MHNADELTLSTETVLNADGSTLPLDHQTLGRLEAFYSRKIQEHQLILLQLRQKSASETSEVQHFETTQLHSGPDYVVRPARAA